MYAFTYLIIYYGFPELAETVLTALDLALSLSRPLGGFFWFFSSFFLRREKKKKKKEQQQKPRFKNKRLQSLIWNHMRHERSESAREQRIAL